MRSELERAAALHKQARIRKWEEVRDYFIAARDTLSEIHRDTGDPKDSSVANGMRQEIESRIESIKEHIGGPTRQKPNDDPSDDPDSPPTPSSPTT